VTEGLGSIAIVHDYLNQRGGAERVVLEMASMWSPAPIYTSLYRPESTFPEFRSLDVRTSPLIPYGIDRGFRNLFPLYPAAFRSLGTLEHDTIVSSSSGWAHSARAVAGAFYAVYCHTPARWLYGHEYLGASRRQLALRPVLGGLKHWDRHAALRADLYIANSHQVRRRIRSHYGIDAPVVYPPVDVDRFTPRERGERLLVVSRLLPYKRVDVVVRAATRAGLGLDVVGTGPELGQLREWAGPTIEFHGRLSDADVTRLMESCRALCVPGQEDFGITAVEAQAAGKPVVAFGAGGALETIEEGRTGAFFRRREPEDVLAAIWRCDAIETPPAAIALGARRFSRAAFRTALVAVLADRVRAHREWLGARRHDARDRLALTG
jgi:glycosyltransferase involved in cell wall biosynthesis